MDIGETAYSMVLADDLDGDEKLDLVLATMNGNVYCFRTAARAHPLSAWPSEVRAAGHLCWVVAVCPHDHISVVTCFRTAARPRPLSPGALR